MAIKTTEKPDIEITSEHVRIQHQDLPPLVENGVQQTNVFVRLKTIWQYRELLNNLIRKELKIKYKDSFLGFVWSLLNPLLYLAIYSLVFGFLLQGSIELFGIFLLAGLLPYNLFSVGLMAATTSITSNGPLVQKVWFPREILPIAAVGANLINFCFQLIILVGGLAVFRLQPEWSMLWLLFGALFATLLLTIGLGLILSAVNVYFRDVQHFLELGLAAWFWLTPIVYHYGHIANALTERLGLSTDRFAMINPMTPMVTIFQRVAYNPTNFPEESQQQHFSELLRPTSWHAINLAIATTGAFLLFYFGLKLFAKLEANLGEEI